MPAPVEFNISVGALPPGFQGDPQALAQAIADRLMISPSEPWSSFINGGAEPASNVGPFLAAGLEWKVWSDSLGRYTFQTVDGAGLVTASVKRDAMEDGTPNSVLIYDGAGRPTMISGIPGEQLSVGPDLLPFFGPPATGVFFTMQLSTGFDYVADGTARPIPFNTVLFSQGVVPDTTLNRIPVTAGSVWVFGASVQIENINGAVIGVQHGLNIRPYLLDATSFGSLFTHSAAMSRSGLQTQGIYYFQNAGYVDVAIGSVDNVGGTDFSISNNGINTRFYGFRLL